MRHNGPLWELEKEDSMSVMRRFRALRPPAACAAELACVPYDVISSAEARQLAAGKPRSLLHVTRPEIDLPEGTGLYDDAVYEKAAANLRLFLEKGWLEEDPEPGLLIYRLIRDGHEQTGVVGCCSVDEYDQDLIVKHEKTRPDKEDDRTRHVLTLSCHGEPVFLAHTPHAGIDRLVAEATTAEPLYDVTAEDGVRHLIWRAQDPAAMEAAFAELPRLYVADGHHRSASASRARAARRDANPAGHTGDEEYNFFLATVFPSDQLRILAYNRVVKDLADRSAGQFLEELGGLHPLRPDAPPVPGRAGEVSVYLAGRWHGLELRGASEAPPSDPVDALDIARLQDTVLAPLLGIGDPRTDKRIDFVGGIRGPEELAARVDRGDAAVAFSMYPTSMEELMRVADAGRVMPPKSTWFEPKLRSGLFLHRF
jgi:uncharacterized protein (DUF1015 family)